MKPYDLRQFLSIGSKKSDAPAEAKQECTEKSSNEDLSLRPRKEETPKTPILGIESKNIETPKIAASSKDEHIAKTIHELVMASGWIPTRTSPEPNYYFYTYLPPASKRAWMQARVYVSKLNLSRIITIEGLTIPAGLQHRLNIVIRMQKSGGVGQMIGSKTITQVLDTENYFNANSEVVNEEGLRAVLSAYLRQAEIL